MSLALVLLLAVVLLGHGGYAPWASLALELGAGACIAGLALGTFWRSSELRERRRRAWKGLPLRVRHPGLARWWRAGPARAEVEISLPGEREESSIELDVGRNHYVLGVPLKRTGLGLPVMLLSIWLLVSTVPLAGPFLELLSPEAYRWRIEASALIGEDVGRAPWSLAPFLTLRSFWLWVALVAVFFASLRSSRRAENVVTMALSLLIVGAGSGALGLVEWLSGLQSLFGRNPEALRASGSFGNPNHYALFQAMLLPVGIGWLAHFRERRLANGIANRRGGRAPAFRRDGSSALGLMLLAGLGMILLGLGLVMSLSRSGLAVALAGCAAWAFFTRRAGDRRPFWALAMALAGVTVWIAMEPLLGRFENLEEEWALEQGRPAVWRDSLPAVGDFWLTGSGLSTFRYVGAAYRTFGGKIFYSWAHNDYLQLGIELGLPGLLLLAWIAAIVVRAARRVRSDLAGDTALVQLHAGFVAALVAVALHSITDFGLHLPANFALLAIVLGVVVGLERPGATSQH